MDAASIAGTICDLLVDMPDEPLPFDSPTVIATVVHDGEHVFVTASDGKVYRVTVEPWP